MQKCREGNWAGGGDWKHLRDNGSRGRVIRRMELGREGEGFRSSSTPPIYRCKEECVCSASSSRECLQNMESEWEQATGYSS